MYAEGEVYVLVIRFHVYMKISAMGVLALTFHFSMNLFVIIIFHNYVKIFYDCDMNDS